MGRPGAHGRSMHRPGGNHLDRQRRLRPRDYIVADRGFGNPGHYQVVVPADGDRRSANVAAMQHRLVTSWRKRRPRSGAAVAEEFGFSKQVWSRSVLGDRWMGETVMVALLAETTTTRSDQTKGPSK